MHDFKEIGEDYRQCSICGLSEPFATTNNEPCRNPKSPTPFGLLERFVKWLGRTLFTDNYAYEAVALIIIMGAVSVFVALCVITNFGF